MFESQISFGSRIAKTLCWNTKNTQTHYVVQILAKKKQQFNNSKCNYIINYRLKRLPGTKIADYQKLNCDTASYKVLPDFLNCLH